MLYTFADRGVARSVAFVFRPDWFTRPGQLTLCVLAHGGNQNVTEWLQDAVHAADLLSAQTGFIDEFGALVTPSPSEAHHPGNLVVVAPAGMMWNRVEAGGWSSHIGQDGLLLDPPDVDFMSRLPAHTEALFRKLYVSIVGAEPPGPVFLRSVYLGFSNGACLGFRVASERPGVYQAFALAGSNCAGYEYTWEQELELPPWQYLSPFAPGAADATQTMHLTAGIDDEKFSFAGATATTPPEKIAGAEAHIGAAPGPGWDADATWSPEAWWPLQFGWEAPEGVGQWVATVDPAAPITVDPSAPGVFDRSNAAGAKIRIALVEGMGHDVPSSRSGEFDWLPAVVRYFLT